MQLRQLRDTIKRLEINPRNLDADVKIVVKLPYATVGAVPMVHVKSVQLGFDWEAGSFMIYPEESLTQHDVDFGEKFREVQKKNGDLQYENMGLKSEVKRLKKLLQKHQDGI